MKGNRKPEIAEGTLLLYMLGILMVDSSESWGSAEFEVLSIANLGNSAMPTVVELRMFGEIRGEACEKITTLVAPKTITTYNMLAEEINYNCLYPWVEEIISRQDAANEVMPQ